jgi:alkylation response protein AidB-like acyl-CoA dehydrogenase
MATITNDDRAALVDALHRLLADRCTEADVRRTMDSGTGHDPALWAQLSAMGIAGLLVDESHGGAGGSAVDIEAVMEEAGAALLGAPLLSSGVLAATLLQSLGDNEANKRLLPAIADGSRVATVALTGPAGGWTPQTVAIAASQAGNGWTLLGAASFVTHANIADILLVVARTADGFGVFEVDRDAAGLTRTDLPTFDHGLRMARIDLDQTAAHRLASKGTEWDAVEAALDMARVALAGEQAGGTRRVLNMTVDYAKSRVQFGRAIGSFQAIKHMATDMLLEAESATSAARHAARALADEAPDAAAAINLAAFTCADAYATATATSIQMHGGIAFTWDHPAHLYLRRARAAAQLFGNSNFYRERFVQQLELQS